MKKYRREIIAALVIVIAVIAFYGMSQWENLVRFFGGSSSDEVVGYCDEGHSADSRLVGAGQTVVLGTDDPGKSVEAVGGESPNAGLGWSGEMYAHADRAWLFANYDDALKYYPHLKAAESVDRSKPVLVCEIGLENISAVSDGDREDEFNITFLSLSAERYPVQYFDSGLEGGAEKDFYHFVLPQGYETTYMVGFSVPESWIEDRANCYENAYLYFGYYPKEDREYIKLDVYLDEFREGNESDREIKWPDVPSFFDPLVTNEPKPVFGWVPPVSQDN